MSGTNYSYPPLRYHAEPIGYQPAPERENDAIATAVEKTLIKFMAQRLKREKRPSPALISALELYVKSAGYDILASGSNKGDTTVILRPLVTDDLDLMLLGKPQIYADIPSATDEELHAKIGIIFPERNETPFIPDRAGHLFVTPDGTEQQLRSLNQSEEWQTICNVVFHEKDLQNTAQKAISPTIEEDEQEDSEAGAAHNALLAAQEEAAQTEALLKGLRSEWKLARHTTRSERNRARKENRPEKIFDRQSIDDQPVKKEIAPEFAALISELEQATSNVSHAQSMVVRTQGTLARLQKKIADSQRTIITSGKKRTKKEKQDKVTKEAKRQKQLENLEKDFADATARLDTAIERQATARQALIDYEQTIETSITALGTSANIDKTYWKSHAIYEVFRETATLATANTQTKQNKAQEAKKSAFDFKNIAMVLRQAKGDYLPKHNVPGKRNALKEDQERLDKKEAAAREAALQVIEAEKREALIQQKMASVVRKFAAHIQTHGEPINAPSDEIKEMVKIAARKNLNRFLRTIAIPQSPKPKPPAP